MFPVPPLGLKLLFGEMAQLVESQRVLPRAAEASGFRFRIPNSFQARTDLLRRRYGTRGCDGAKEPASPASRTPASRPPG
jgi:hypothetical protein